MTKEEIIEVILAVCKNNGLEVNIKYKSEKWNSDVVVSYSTYKVAFNVCKNPRNVESTYYAMRKERVCGCWLLMPSKYATSTNDGMPCFQLTEESNENFVFLNYEDDSDFSNKINLYTFVYSLIKGEIRWAKQIIIKYIDVCFFKIECWKCHKNSDIYFIDHLISNEGISVKCNMNIEELTFNHEIVDPVVRYIKFHPELHITMGKIKPRYSNTMRQSYPSFGCAYCDSIFGKFYIKNYKMEYIYGPEASQKARIEINDNISVPANCWYKRNI